MQESEEELPLQVSVDLLVLWWNPGAPPRLSSPLLFSAAAIFILFRCLPSVHLSVTTPRSLRRAFNFQRHNRKCHLLPFDRFSHGAQRQPNANFTLYEKKGRRCQRGASPGLRCRGGGGGAGPGGGGFSSRVFGFSLQIIISAPLPSPSRC